MSFYDDASLIMFPSGYKEDKIYSLKPTDGSGDLTFTRASTATRVNAEGLIEKVRTNLLTYSNTFSNAAWIKTNQGVGSVAVVTPNYTTDPFGGNNAWRFECNLNGGTTTNDRSWMLNTFSPFANTTSSIYIKLNIAGSKTIILSNGGGDVQTITSTEWVRINIVTLGSSGEFRIGLIGGTGSSDTLDCSIAFAQAEVSDVATEYIPTTTAAVSVGMLADVPRIDYTGGGCGSLLLEKQSTNLAFPSEDLTALTTGGMTNTANQTISPDGTQNADKSTIGTTTRFYDVITEPIIVATIGTTYTTSFFAKKGTGIESIYFFQGDGIRIAKFNLNNGAYIGHSPSDGYNAFSSYSSQSLGNGWYRFTATYTAATTVGKFVIGVSTNTNNSVTAISGNGTDFVYVWGLQYEIGSYVSSYIPTVASSVTRLADSASKTGISSLIGQTQGTLFVDIDVINLNPSNVSRIILSDGTTNNYIFLGINEAGSGNLSRLFINNFGTSFSLSLFSSTAITIGLHKLALAYKSGEFALYLDGNSVASSSATGTIPATSQIVIGGTSPSTISNLETLVLNKSILFPTRLTNTELAELTTL